MINVRRIVIVALILVTGGNVSVSVSNSKFQTSRSPFSALVKPEEAVFSLHAPERARWVWRRQETRENMMEYRMDVSVKNNGRLYTFGFYLWKRGGASQQSGSLEDLIKAGQVTVFERTEPRRMTRVSDAGIKLGLDRNLVTIRIKGRDHVRRLFSDRPADATFKIITPETEAVEQTIPINYED